MGAIAGRSFGFFCKPSMNSRSSIVAERTLTDARGGGSVTGSELDSIRAIIQTP